MGTIIFQVKDCGRTVPRALLKMAQVCEAQLQLEERVICELYFYTTPIRMGKALAKARGEKYKKGYMVFGDSAPTGQTIRIFCGGEGGGGVLDAWTPSRWARTLAHEAGHAEHFHLFPESRTFVEQKSTEEPQWDRPQCEAYANEVENRLAGHLPWIDQVKRHNWW